MLSISRAFTCLPDVCFVSVLPTGSGGVAPPPLHRIISFSSGCFCLTFLGCPLWGTIRGTVLPLRCDSEGFFPWRGAITALRQVFPLKTTDSMAFAPHWCTWCAMFICWCTVFGACFFWSSNLGLLGRIPLSECAQRVRLRIVDKNSPTFQRVWILKMCLSEFNSMKC